MEKTLQKIENTGAQILYTCECGKNGVITYLNRIGEYWTACTSNGKLTDIMMKADNLKSAAENHSRWVSYL